MASATPTTVTVTFNPTAINLQADVIGGATTSSAGAMTALQVQQLAGLAALTPAVVADLLTILALFAADAGPKIYTNALRPLPNDPMFADALADGRVAVIWNSTDSAPNFSNGVNWYDAAGNLT